MYVYLHTKLHTLFDLSRYILFFLIIYGSGNALLKIPKEMINIPNKDYWLADENIPAFKAKWEYAIFQFGSVLMLLFLAMSLLIIEANFSNPIKLSASVFASVMFGFLLFMVYWIISFYRLFRLPK